MGAYLKPAYYLQDSCSITCGTCTLDALRQELADNRQANNRDTVRRLAAIDRYATMDGRPFADIDDYRSEVNYAAGRYSSRYSYNPANRKALDLFHDLVYTLTNDDYSERGESCEGCGEELSEAYVSCGFCRTAEYESEFPFPDPLPEIDWDGDGPVSPYCQNCEDDYRASVIVLDDDGRGYQLRYNPTTRFYSAGCRRFTVDQALTHWGNPDHPRPAAANNLFNAVLRHAIGVALPRLADR